MTTQTFFALFWGWLTVIVIAMFFIRPKALHDVKRLIVDNRAFGLTYGYLSLPRPGFGPPAQRVDAELARSHHDLRLAGADQRRRRHRMARDLG